MCRKETKSKGNNTANGKRGFTLVEISIVLALIAIISVMIASFSVLMNKYAKNDITQYAFLEDCANVKDGMTALVREYDVSGNVFTVYNNSIVVGTDTIASFNDSKLTLKGATKGGIDEIHVITFEQEGNLIKCVMTHVGDDGENISHSFVLSLHCATIAEGGTAE